MLGIIQYYSEMVVYIFFIWYFGYAWSTAGWLQIFNAGGSNAEIFRGKFMKKVD